jgi:carotenoid 1,2-hydratase
MTERGAHHVERSAREFVIGPSSLRWDGQSLVIDVNELSLPFGQSVKGTIRIDPHGLNSNIWALDRLQRHHWGPIAPSAQIDVKLQSPDLHWKGHAYFDANIGSEAVNQSVAPAFVDWDWSRASLADGSTAVIYDVRESNGQERLLALKFSKDSSHVSSFEAPVRQALPRTKIWQMHRSLRCDPDSISVVDQTLEDTPFYVRSVVKSTLLGERVLALHETLSVPRLSSKVTQCLLPFRMPRTG